MRLRYNNSTGTTSVSLSNSQTSISFSSAPTWATIVSPNYIPVTLDTGTNTEIVHITAYTSGGTNATMTRGQEGTSAVSHLSGITWGVDTTALDFTGSTSYVFNVLAYNADATGTADSTSAINAAIADAQVLGGTVFFPQGTYKTTSTIVCNTSTSPYYPVYFKGSGMWNTFIQPTWTTSGTSTTHQDAIWMYNSNAYDAINVGGFHYGGGISDLTVDGTNMTGNYTTGIHYGDLHCSQISNVGVQNFTGTGSYGFHFDNYYYQTEQMTVTNAFVESAGTAYVFNCNPSGNGNTGHNGSFDRAVLNLRMDQSNVTGSGVLFTNGAYITGGKLDIWGNFLASGTPSTYVLGLQGSTSEGGGSPSSLVRCAINIGVEADGSGSGPHTVSFSGSGVMDHCYGLMDFSIGTFQASVSPNVTTWLSNTGSILGDGSL